MIGPGSIILLVIILFPVFSCVWGYKDAKKKGKSNTFALGILFLILLLPFLGWIIYLLIRKS